ncbi:hypothetical protein ACVIGB_006544 [Bradyrhizobium sp. USDA 4341]
MSGVDNAPPSSPERRPAKQSGCLGLLMIVVGAHLLLPGLCTLFFFGGQLSDPSVAPIAEITFLLGLVGVVSIVVGILRR